MTIDTIIFGFVNGNIKAEAFEKYLYENVSLFENNMDSNLFMQLISLDFSNKKETIIVKKRLKDSLESASDKYNDAYFELEIEKDDDLKKLVSDCNLHSQSAIFECGNICSSYELHLKIKSFFDFPYWYGMNWTAFNDIIDLSDFTVLVLKDFGSLQKKLPQDSDEFLKILNENNQNECRILIQ